MFFIINKRQLEVLMLCFIIIIASIVTITRRSPEAVQVSASNTNWGLSFREKGKQPAGNASATYLKQYNAFFVGADDKKMIYLTFDAGFENGYTAKILDTLKKHKVKATFFLVGNYLKTSPDLVKRMVSEGHIVGNHTFSHPDMSKISSIESFKKEMVSVEDMYLDITGTKLQKFYRPPQGKYSVANLKQANELGYKTVFWSLAYVDWYQDKQPTKEQAFEKLIPRIHPGAVVLLHSTSKTNAEILDELLTKWEAAGYQFGTLNDLCK